LFGFSLYTNLTKNGKTSRHSSGNFYQKQNFTKLKKSDAKDAFACEFIYSTTPLKMKSAQKSFMIKH